MNRTWRLRWVIPLLALLLVACDGAGGTASPIPTAEVTATPTSTPAPTETPTPSPEVTAEATATPEIIDLRATRMRIPSLGIDAPVQVSEVIPDTTPVAAGCTPKVPGATTLTVPEQGITTPAEAFEGIENKSWIFGHSRWQNQPGLLFALQEIELGDEIFVEGLDRGTGEAIKERRYVVEGIYLTDKESGSTLIRAETPAEIPAEPLVILQTSARGRGPGAQWLLDEELVMSKAENLIEGDLDDPCKYLLLFVIARAS